MAYVKQVRVGDTTYDIKPTEAASEMTASRKGIGRPDNITVNVSDGIFSVNGAVIPTYERESATEYDSDWLSLTDGGSALSPDIMQTYRILEGDHEGEIYYWNGTQYVQIAGGSGPEPVVNFLEGWLTAADLNPALYADLDAVFADEKAVRKLFTIHDAVDFLVDNASDENVSTIINNDYCAKWINLRDYALDTLYANATIAALMDTADKYFYGEWALMPQVPVMTSNTTPYGTAIRSSVYAANTEAYCAFDGEKNTVWLTPTGTTNNYVGYNFVSPVMASKVKILILYNHGSGYQNPLRSFVIQGSNDGFTSDIHDLGTFDATPHSSGEFETIEVTLTGSVVYSSLRIFCSDTLHISGTWSICIAELQFYAWQPKGNVPVMTSNTAPYGEAFADAEQSGAPAYQVFNDNNSYNSKWSSSSAIGNVCYVGYKFTNPICVKKIAIAWLATMKSTFKVQGSNDKSTWVDLTNEIIHDYSSTSGYTVTDMIPVSVSSNTNYYLYYRVYILAGQTGDVSKGGQISELQFYGRELKVSVPTMTSNTAPYGEVIYSSYVDNAYAYNAFNGNLGNGVKGWVPSTNNAGEWLGNFFTNPVIVKKVLLASRNTTQTILSFQGSNDGTTWNDLKTNIISISSSYNTATISMLDINNDTPYLRYRMIVTSGQIGVSSNGIQLQFYGLDYSEYDWDEDNPRHYIYDHGVEVNETIEGQNINTSKVFEKRPSELYFGSDGNRKCSGFRCPSLIDLSNYSLMRMAEGKQLYSNMSVLYRPTVYETSNAPTPDTAYIAMVTISPSNFIPYNNSLDINSLNGAYQIAINTFNGTEGSNIDVTITEWWLE